MKHDNVTPFLFGIFVGAFIIFIVASVAMHPNNNCPEKKKATKTEYTKNGMTYIEFPRGSVANYTLDSMARESRVVLSYQQFLKPCP